MNTRHTLALGLSSLAFLSAPAGASPVTTVPGGIDNHVITFSLFDGPAHNVAHTFADPVDVGTGETGIAVNLEFSDANAHILGNAPVPYGSATWPLDGAFAGINEASGNMTFSFATGMNFAGALVNIDSAFDGDVTITALGEDGGTLLGEEITLNPHSFTSGFYGFSRSSADIFALVFSSANIAVDNFSFGTTSTGTGVPEPATTALVLASLGALALTRRRQR